MSMRQAILTFPQQLLWNPEEFCERGFFQGKTPILAGMGGSHLAADLLMAMDPSLSVRVHSDYGLPADVLKEPDRFVLVASSYSGNTEETLDAYQVARTLGMELIVLASGGRLIECAQEDEVPFIQLPHTGIQPRSALGYSLVALLMLLGEEELLAQARLCGTMDAVEIEEEAKRVADTLEGLVPVVIASRLNYAVAMNWKIKLNETGKTPAFANMIPEMNHNEMTGFDTRNAINPPSDRFGFVLMRDEEDHVRNQRRMEVMAELYKERGYPVVQVTMQGVTRMERLLKMLLLGDWVALTLAERYGLESEQVPMVETFKRLL